MRILLTKLSDDRHAMEVVRRDGSRERVELVTREFLFHDLLHFALESQIGSAEGFWGALATGKTLADVNDRSGRAMAEFGGAPADIEQAVGALTGAIKRRAADYEVIEALGNLRSASGLPIPPWFDGRTVDAVRERMRRLQGRWKATGYGGTMELDWAD